MSEESVGEELGIHEGVIIESAKAKYTITKLLGEGGFGVVFKCFDTGNKNREYAMKIEKKIDTRRHSKLKMEIAILKLVANAREGVSHFTAIIDRGKKDTYFFLVMELVGKSLADLKSARAGKVFTIGTGIGAAIQSLEAIEDLHKQGYLHRDIKSANFAIGLLEKRRTVYILDFGIARKFLNESNELKTPRVIVGFKGTVRFASLSCHKNQEMGKKDDCESWFYLLLDLVVATGLPWKKMSDKKAVLACKEKSRKQRAALFNGIKCDVDFGKVVDYIDSLKYFSKVDYQFIYNSLKKAADVAGVNLADQMDWEREDLSKEDKDDECSGGE
uniref:Protein kinase domain-containing protein n=1 Tax=Rhabditophanes sp. KR3021 TaxID=114890 RepID=A0AC35TTL2_9BILA